jgi:hypothetical protein
MRPGALARHQYIISRCERQEVLQVDAGEIVIPMPQLLDRVRYALRARHRAVLSSGVEIRIRRREFCALGRDQPIRGVHPLLLHRLNGGLTAHLFQLAVEFRQCPRR